VTYSLRFVSIALAALVYGHIAAAFDSTQTPVIGERPLLLILSHNPSIGDLEHDENWYRERIFGTGTTPSIYRYFRQQSGKQFRFTEAGVVRIADDVSDELNRAAGVNSEQPNRERIARRSVHLASEGGFDFAAYDTNRDGRVTNDELTVLVIERPDGRGTGGATTQGRCMDVSGIRVCSRVAIAGHRSELANYAHELSHTIDPISVDLYGKRCNSYNATLMSCTAGAEFDSLRLVYLDPWHRARLGWQGAVSSASVNDIGSTYQIAPVGNEMYEPEVLTVQGPSAGESITFEVRRHTRYDFVTPRGDFYEDYMVLAWYVHLNSRGNPHDVLALAPPVPQDVVVRPINRPVGGFNPSWPIDNLTRTRLLVFERGTDKAVFTLAPVRNCELNPWSYNSRGRTASLTSGEYEMRWRDGSRTTFFIEPLDSEPRYAIRIDNGSGGQRSCVQP
jgi:M6 family metalloprotease-like protein